MEHSHHRVRNSLPLSDEQMYDAMSALSAEEREKFLRLIRTKLMDGDPLIRRIDVAVENMSQGLEHSGGEVVADEVKQTEIAAWRTFETLKEAAGRESVQMTEEYRSGRVGRMEHLLSI